MKYKKNVKGPDFRAMIERLEDGIAIVRRGKTLYRSPIWAERLGDAAQGEDGRSYFDYIVPEDKERVLRLYRKKLEEYESPDPGASEPLHFEVTLQTEAGERITADVKTHLFPFEGQPATMLVLRDVTEQKKIERALRLSEERYRLVTELTSDFSYALRLTEQGELRTEWVTGAYTKVTGYAAGEIWARGGWEALIHHDDQKRARATIRASLSGQVVVDEYRFVSKEGKTVWVRAYVRPMLDEESERVVGVIGAVQDITARKQAEQALAQRNAQLREANRQLEELHRAKDEVTSTISHELRTPLVTGLGYVELVLSGALGSVPSKIRGRLKKALGSLTRLHQLIDGLLQYNSFLNMDFFESHTPAPIDIVQLVRDTAADFRIRTHIAEQRLVLNVPPSPVSVLATPEPMRIVLENLLNNAAAHAGEDARIEISVSSPNHGRVRVEVSDDGAGIPDDLLDRVWNLFFKAKESQERLGLGLAIVQAILRSHQTEPHLESKPGQGTIIWFELPTEGKA